MFGEFSTGFEVKGSLHHCGIPYGVLTVTSELGNAMRGMELMIASQIMHLSSAF